MKGRFRILMVVALAVGVLAPTTRASFILYMDDPGDLLAGLTITDNGAGDSNPIMGMITYSGAVGANWTANVTTGTSKPVIGGPTEPRLDLNSIDVTSLGGGTLDILLTDTDFYPAPTWTSTTLISAIGGTTDGTVWLDQILDVGNAEFAPLVDAELSVSLGPLTGDGLLGAFASAGTDLGSLVSGPFSLTEIAKITHTASGQITSFNAESTVVPVPTAVILGALGLGVVGLKLRKYA